MTKLNHHLTFIAVHKNISYSQIAKKERGEKKEAYRYKGVWILALPKGCAAYNGKNLLDFYVFEGY